MKLSQIVLLLQLLLLGFVNASQYKRTCPDKCGNVPIPYPFGIEEGCYLDESYYIECNSTTQIPILNVSTRLPLWTHEFRHQTLEVLDININGSIRVNLPIAHRCYDEWGKTVSGSMTAVSTSRFPLSSTQNWFTGVGCGIEASIGLKKPSVVMKCRLTCGYYYDDIVKNGSCLGHGCCQVSIPQGMTFAGIDINISKNQTMRWQYSRCGYAFIVEKDQYTFDINNLGTMSSNMSFPALLDWSVGFTSCEEAQKADNITYMCPENSVCYNGESGLIGYRCKCSNGYSGNPYIQNGCQDVNECEYADLNDCMAGYCKNTYGSYDCICPNGYQGNAKIGGGCTLLEPQSKSRSVIEGISEGVAGAAVAMFIVYCGAKRRIRVKGRKDLFKKNELLTGTKIHSLEIPLTVYRGAAAYFTWLLECDLLVQVLDDELKRDEYPEVVKHFTKIAINCLDLEGKIRPTMIQVKHELQQLRCDLLSIEAQSI
ncbi:hypothetical protein L1887_21045 [Cichorium endivia]|nr:hypothetical protein L1887_21045 [Cichorium endivia]